MMRKKIRNLLIDLGFYEDTADVYTLLLTEGPLSVQDILNKFNLSSQKLNLSLGKLILNRLVYEDGEQFWVLNPQKSLKAFYNEALWSKANTLNCSLDDVQKEHFPELKKKKRNYSPITNCNSSTIQTSFPYCFK